MSQESRSEDRLTQLLTAFEAAWQQGKSPPEIADFHLPAGADPTERRRLLIDLVMIDLDFRWRHSSRLAPRDEAPPIHPSITIAHQPRTAATSLPERPVLEHYIERYPELGPLAELPDELIAYEFRVRCSWGDRPTAEMYRRRFGQERASLWRQLDEIVRETETAAHERSLDSTQRPQFGQALKIRCPHCHNPVEILNDQSIDEIKCPSCDTVFSLIGRNDVASGQSTTPRRIGHFELIEQVGEGAFGAVWKARDTQLERIIAIKIPRRTQLDAADVEKFIREARAAAQLKHANIVSVYEVGREHDTVFIVSDFIEGLSLDKWLAAGANVAGTLRVPSAGIVQLPPTEAAQLCRKIADALHHAHEAGIVHRDLKPSNIMIDAAGEPHVMDFGLAKREAGEITMTVEGQILGTPAYMSPEQAKGEGHAADRRSDVYSLGVILFELLTGERPFRGNIRMLLQQVLEDTPPSPRKLDARIPKDLETITLKCLDKDPAKRYSHAQLLAEELGRYLEHRPIVARPISRRERARKWCKRKPVVAALSASVVLAVAAGLVGTSLFALDARREAAEKSAAIVAVEHERARADQEAVLARDERDRADDEARQAVAQERKAARRLYYSDIARAQQLWDDGQMPAARQVLDSCSLDWRGWEHDYLFTKFSRGELARFRHSLWVRSVAFSPDGKKIVSGDGGHDVLTAELKVWDATSGKEILKLKVRAGDVSSVAFSPDGKQIASGSRTDDGLGEISIWDATSGEKTRTIQGHDATVSSIAFSPEGKRIASGSPDSTIIVWDATSGAGILTLKGHRSPVTSVAFSPDGKQIASGNETFEGLGEIRVWDVLSGEERLTLKGHTFRVDSVVFSPDGKRIVSGSEDKTLKVWDATSGAEILALKGHRSSVTSVAFSPDGKQIASGSNDHTVKLWDATGGKEIRTLKGHTGDVATVAFSPDGKRLASGSHDHTVIVWDATIREETFTLKDHTGRVASVAFSPDGKEIASGSGDNSIAVWDATNGQKTHTLKGHTGDVTSVAFSPGGKWIASGSEDHTVKVWDAVGGQETRTMEGHTKSVTSVAFSPDGKRIASGSSTANGPGEIKIWDAFSGEESLTLKGHTEFVATLAFSPDGKRLASGSWDSTIIVWDVANGAKTLELSGHTGPVNSVAFSPDGKRIASCAEGNPDVLGKLDGPDELNEPGELKLWDATGGQHLVTLKGHTRAIRSVVFSPDGKWIASGSDDQSVKVWNATSGEETLTIKGHLAPVHSLAFSPNGKRLASGSGDSTIRVWDATRSEDIRRRKRHTSAVRSVAFSPDGKRLASGSLDGTVKVWDTSSGDVTLTLQGHTGAVTSVAFSPNGERLASSSEDTTVKVWDASDDEQIRPLKRTLKGHTGPVNSVAFSADGASLVSGSMDKTIKVWDATSGRETLAFKNNTSAILSVAFSPDGKRIASGGGDRFGRGEIKIWDVANSEKTCEMFETICWSVAFSPDGKRLATGGDKVTIWDATNGKRILTINQYKNYVSFVAFSPGGERIASGSEDGTVKLWDVTSGREIFGTKGHTGPVYSVAFSPDGKRVASGGGDDLKPGEIKIWDVVSGKETLTP